jgi:ribosomal protein L28
MSRVCDITGTKSQRGKKITKIWGVKYRSIRHRQPNLIKATVLVDGIKTQLKVTAKALKSIKRGLVIGVKAIDYTKKVAE